MFVVATIGLTGRSAWLATGGAFLGVAAAVAIGVGVVKGSSHLHDQVLPGHCPRAGALAAGIAMTTVHTANAAGWITFGQTPQFDLSWLAPPGSVLSSFTTGMLGIQPYPVPDRGRGLAGVLPSHAGRRDVAEESGAIDRCCALRQHLDARRPASGRVPRRDRLVPSASWLVTGGAVIVLGIGLIVYWAPWQTAAPGVAAQDHGGQGAVRLPQRRHLHDRQPLHGRRRLPAHGQGRRRRRPRRRRSGDAHLGRIIEGRALASCAQSRRGARWFSALEHLLSLPPWIASP